MEARLVWVPCVQGGAAHGRKVMEVIVEGFRT